MSEIVSLLDPAAGSTGERVNPTVVGLLCGSFVLCSNVPSRSIVAGAPVSPHAVALDEETIVATRHLSSGYPARNRDDTVNAVIEIPTGTTAKFEVDEDDGFLRWALDREDRSRREIDYLAYPVNYGMVPRTLAADGDPLDVLVLGRGIERASVASTRIIGVLEMQHDGIRDDKLIAVPLDNELVNGFSRLRELEQLDAYYPESRAILVLWFSNYWGRGATEVVGWGNAAEANAILDEAIIQGSEVRELPTMPRDSADPHPRAAPPCAAPAGAPQSPRPR